VPDASSGAIPLAVDIEQFWAWFEPGALQASVEFESRVRINGPIVLDGPSQTVRSGMQVATPLAVDSTWQQVVQSGVDTLVSRIAEKVQPAATTNFATTRPQTSLPRP
jgi:hypothetical protein